MGEQQLPKTVSYTVDKYDVGYAQCKRDIRAWAEARRKKPKKHHSELNSHLRGVLITDEAYNQCLTALVAFLDEQEGENMTRKQEDNWVLRITLKSRNGAEAVDSLTGCMLTLEQAKQFSQELDSLITRFGKAGAAWRPQDKLRRQDGGTG